MPAGDRAVRIRDRVDEAYWRFVDDLPRPLRELARRHETYSGKPGPEPFGGVSRLSALIVGAPWLFWDLFASLPDEQLAAITEAGSCLGVACILLDHLVDDQAAEPAMAALLGQACYERAISLFQGLFEPGKPFWSHLDRLWAELRYAFASEWLSQRDPVPISEADFRLWAQAKSAPIIITFAALAQVDDQLALLEAAEGSMKEGGPAAQLDHDVGDWSADIQDHHLTYFLSQVMTAGELGPEWPTEEQFQAALQAQWLDVEYTKQARAWCARAIDLGRTLDCPSYMTFLDKCYQYVDSHLDRYILNYIVKVSERLFSQEPSPDDQADV